MSSNPNSVGGPGVSASQSAAMDTLAVVLERPRQLVLSRLGLDPPGPGEAMVDIHWSGISTGTERLLWSGQMPDFPGMGYPLVPGYESVGEVVAVGPDSRHQVGERVFVSGARCFGDIRGLFGGAASRLVVADDKLLTIDEGLREQGVLLALAATARHAIAGGDQPPELIIGHGVLGRLLARLTVMAGHPPPRVWELDEGRRQGAQDYLVLDPERDERRDYRVIFDVSGDTGIFDRLISHLAPGGEIVLAGFYTGRVGFDFPPAFMREARFRIAAEWQPEDLLAVRESVQSGNLSLDGLITHRRPAADAAAAYQTAFSEPACLKMVLNWRDMS